MTKKVDRSTKQEKMHSDAFKEVNYDLMILRDSLLKNFSDIENIIEGFKNIQDSIDYKLLKETLMSHSKQIKDAQDKATTVIYSLVAIEKRRSENEENN